MIVEQLAGTGWLTCIAEPCRLDVRFVKAEKQGQGAINSTISNNCTLDPNGTYLT